MLTYDKKTNTLYGYQNEIALRHKPPESHDYESFLDYINNQVKDDVIELFMPKLLDCLKLTESELTIDTTDEFGGIKVEQGDAGYFNDRCFHVKVKFISTSFYNDDEHDHYVTILKIPSVDENGIIEYQEKQYALIKMLEQDETISYEQDSRTLKLKLERGHVTLSQSAHGPKISISALRSKSSVKKYDAVAVMFAMAKVVGADPLSMFYEFTSSSIRNKYKTASDLEAAIYYYTGNSGSISADEYDDRVVPLLTGTAIYGDGIKNDMCNISSLRNELNEFLSLDRVLGKVLARDVRSELDPEKIVVHKNTVITEMVLTKCKANGVSKLYIDNLPNIEGYYLAQHLFVDRVPKGTTIIDEIRDRLPEETGMYVSRDYVFEPTNPIMFDNETYLTKGLLQFLRQCGISSVEASIKPGQGYGSNGAPIITLYFMEEVISNRHFRKYDINSGVDTNGDWVYLDENGQFQPQQEFFTVHDIQALISIYTQLCSGKYYETVANIDTGFRKKLVMLNTQYHRAFRSACDESFKVMNRTFKEIWAKNPYQFTVPDEIENKFYAFEKNFFRYLREDGKCLQMLIGDVITNPVSYLSALTKVNVYTANKHSVSDSQRRMSIGSYGRVDPYELSQSSKMGVVLNTTIGCNVDMQGIMRTDYYKIIHLGNRSMVTEERVSLTVQEEEKYKIADLCSLIVDKNGMVLNSDAVVLCRTPSVNSIEKMSFSYVPVSEIDLVNCEPNQILSWATSTVPFMGANDAARVVFGVSFAKQAKGLVAPERPRMATRTGAMIPRMNHQYFIEAEDDGVVVSITRNKSSMTNKVVLAVHYNSQDPLDGTRYEFDEYTSSGYSVTVRNILVEEGDTFKKGDTLMTSNFVKEGKLALGVNALIAYVPTGYNYEDGVYASDAICHRLSSYRINSEYFENANKKGKIVINYVRRGRWITPNRDTVLSIATKFAGSKESRKGITKQYKTAKATGFVEAVTPDVKRTQKGYMKYSGVHVDLISVNDFNSGDKMVNRHGNKGVMPKREKNSQMLRLMNGMPCDVIYNPHGAPSRMNIGQVLECHLALVLFVCDFYCEADAFNSISNDEIKMLLSLTVDLMNSVGDEHIGILQSYPEVDDDLKQHMIEKIDRIRMFANCFDKNGEGYLINPKKGYRLTETKVLIGVNTVYKLIQESEKKDHVRGGMITPEPYSLIANAPTKGSSNHGGQRLGTMEMDALSAYGVQSYIDELLNIRGDNGVARSNFNAGLYLPPELAEDVQSEFFGQRRSTSQFLMTMLGLGVRLEADNHEFITPTTNTDYSGATTARTIAYMETREDKEAKENGTDAVGGVKPEKPVEQPNDIKGAYSSLLDLVNGGNKTNK